MFKEVNKLLEQLNYQFTDYNLLYTALTHSSFVNENTLDEINCNERLEFLGDAVLGLVIAEYFFSDDMNYKEGKLSKLRSEVVNEHSLSIVANKLSLGKYIRFGKGELKNGGAENESILADALEALIGAIYLDSNYKIVRDIILDVFNETISNVENKKYITDNKSRFQEYIQRENLGNITYVLENTEGPDNKKIFHSAVKVENEVYGRGVGTTKKKSEQEAARNALISVGELDV